MTKLGWRRGSPPGMDTPDDEVREYINRNIDPLSPRRRWHTQAAAERAWFYYGNQWIRKVSTLAPGGGAYHFNYVDRKTSAAFPHPVTNIIKPAANNEIARLSKKEYVPEVSASKNDPRWMAAASAARDILTWDTQQAMWAAKREQTIFNLVVDGTAIVRTYLDERSTEVTRIASPDAVGCPQCGITLASPHVPIQFLSDGFPGPGEGADRVPLPMNDQMVELPAPGEVPPGMMAGTMRMKVCPGCGQPFQPYDVDQEQAEGGEGGTDWLGNPLGIDVYAGENCIEVVSMHDFYPENGGVRKEPYEYRVWHQMTVRPLDYIYERYPEIDEELEPEEPSKLLRLDPLYSESIFTMNPSSAGGGWDVYSNHARVKEVVVAPCGLPGLEMGAHFVQVADGSISRAELCIEIECEGKPVKVPRIKYHIARHTRVPGQGWGTTFLHDLIPINRRLNEIDAQGIDLRERGTPMIATPEGVEMTIRDDSQGALKIAEYEHDSAPDWDPRASMFPAQPMTASPYAQERNQCFEDAKILGAAQDIERGAPVGGVKTTSGLMLISEEAGQVRGPVERGLVGMYESIFQHMHDMTKAFRPEGGSYERRSDSGFYEIHEWESEELVGTQKIRVIARSGFDQILYKKEATGEAINLGLYDMSSPLAREQALENMSLPKLDQSQSIQIRRAEMAWSAFVEKQQVPLIDETLFNAQIWFLIFGKRWMEDEALNLQAQVRFDEFFAGLSGWQDELAKAIGDDDQQRMIYGGLDPTQWGQTYANLRVAYERALQGAQELQVPPDKMPQPPPKPPEDGQFLPKPMELKIMAVWGRMLGPEMKDALVASAAAEANGIPTQKPVQDMKLRLALLRMRAVIEALHILVARQQAAMMPAAPKPGAPVEPPVTAPA